MTFGVLRLPAVAQRLSAKSRVILAFAAGGLMEKTAQLRLGKRKSAFPAFPQPRPRLYGVRRPQSSGQFVFAKLLSFVLWRLWLWH